MEKHIKNYISNGHKQGNIKTLESQIPNYTENDSKFLVKDLFIKQDNRNQTVYILSEPINIYVKYKILDTILNFRLIIDLKDDRQLTQTLPFTPNEEKAAEDAGIDLINARFNYLKQETAIEIRTPEM